MNGNPLRELDKPDAALRLLLVVSSRPAGITINTLYTFMSRWEVGRWAVDSSRRSLFEAGLIVAKKLRVGPRKNVTILSCTPLGLEVAGKIREIETIMEKASTVSP